MLNGIGYGRVIGKGDGANSLTPAAAEIRYAFLIGLGPLVM